MARPLRGKCGSLQLARCAAWFPPGTGYPPPREQAWEPSKPARLAGQAEGAIVIRACDLDRDLAFARDLAGRQIDASGADLSGMKIRHLGALDGVTWTRETAWPPGIAGQVEKHSGEIRPGVYQVRLGYARDRDELPLA